MTPQTWARWAAVTVAYGAVVLLVYALVRRRIVGAIKALLRSPVDAKSADEGAHLEAEAPLTAA